MIQSESICNIVAATRRKTRSIEFSLNYTKLATLVIRLMWGRAKNCKKILHPVGIEPGTFCNHSDANLASVTFRILNFTFVDAPIDSMEHISVLQVLNIGYVTYTFQMKQTQMYVCTLKNLF